MTTPEARCSVCGVLVGNHTVSEHTFRPAPPTTGEARERYPCGCVALGTPPEGARTLQRLAALAPQVAPETSGHDGYRFTLGYELQSDRDAASEALSLVEHGRLDDLAARLRSSPVSAADGALREAATEACDIYESDEAYTPTALHNALTRLRAALSRVPSSVAASGGEP